MESIKQVLPVSSRSFHARFEDVDARIEGLSRRADNISEVLDAVLSQLSYIRATKDAAPGFYLIAEPGYPNFGDEFIAREWLKYLAALRPEAPVYLDCTRPGPAAAILRRMHPNLVCVDTISRMTFEFAAIERGEDAPGCIAERVSRHIQVALDDEAAAARYASGIHILQHEIRGVHFLGGGYMNGMWQENLARLALATWAKRHGLTVLGTGLGLTPLSGDSVTYVTESVSSFDRLTLRDAGSRAICGDGPNVEIAPDDCFVNGLEGCYDVDPNAPDVMVCVQTDLVDRPDVLNAHVEAILRSWGVMPGDEVGIVECNPYVDYPVFDWLSGAGYSCRLYPAISLLERGFPVKSGGAQQWITTRYHPHVLASAFGCEGCFIPLGSEFYQLKHEAALRMGSHWSEAPIGEEPPAPGRGFDCPTLSRDYMSQIRRSARVLYGA